MLSRIKNWRPLAGALVIGLSTTACAQISPASLVPHLGSDPSQADTLPDTSTPPVQLASTTNGTQPLPPNAVQVTTGSIEETFSATGRVVGAGEIAVNYPGSGKVDAVAVRAGDSVQAGQLLLQTDSTQIQKDLTDARTRLDNDAARVQQALDQAASQSRTAQADATKRAADDQQRRQQAIADATSALHKAQDNMDKVQAGSNPIDIRTAQTTLTNAQTALAKAQTDQDNLQNGANPNDVRNAQAAVTSAQTDVDKAQTQVDLLNKSPDPAAIASAQRDVQRAQVALQVATAAKVDANNTQTMHDAAVANAKLNLQDAQDKLNAVQNPPAPDPSTVAIANRNLQSAQAALGLAKQNLDTVKKGPDQATLDAAQQAVDNAQAVVDNANDRVNELLSHPTPQELQDARDKLSQAQKDLATAQKPVAGATPLDDSQTQFNIQLLQKTAAQDQADVDSLQQQLEATRLLAPSDGVVASVAVKAGDAIDPIHPVMTLSTGGAPNIAIDLTDQDAAKIKQGQTAHVVLDGPGSTPVDATLVSVAPNTTAGVGKTAMLKVTWPDKAPAIGATAQVSIVTQHKDGVLLVPKKAVRSAGTRKFVQYVSGSSRKVANVEVGIVSSDMAEIVSGLTEGQVVIVGP